MLSSFILLVMYFSNCFSQQLTFPRNLFLPRGSCRKIQAHYTNMPQNTSIVFTNWPNSISIHPNTTSLTPSSPSPTTLQFILCQQTNSSPLGRLNLLYYLLNPNQNYTQQQTTPLMVEIQQTPENPKLRPILWKNFTVRGTCAEFNLVTPGNNGVVYYSIRNVWREPYEFYEKLLEYCKEYERACEDGGRGKKREYDDVWVRSSYSVEIQKKGVAKNQTRIIFENDLIQGTSYNICAFYRSNQQNDNSKTSCQIFKTDTSQTMFRAHFQFTTRISVIKLNIFLCFLTNYLGTHLKDILTIDGLSCNPQDVYPSTYYYKTPTKTIRHGNETIVYIDQGCALGRNKMLETRFLQIWNFSDEIGSGFRREMEKYEVGWVGGGENLGLRNVGKMMNPSQCLRIQYTMNERIEDMAGQLSMLYKIGNITSKDYGSVYFIAITFELDGVNKPIFTPSPRQIISCQIPWWISTSPLCQRVILTGSTLQLPQVEFLVPPNSNRYLTKVFYVEVGEYPKFPLDCGEVEEVRFGGKEVGETKSVSNVKKEVKKDEKDVKDVEDTGNITENFEEKNVGKFTFRMIVIWVVGLGLVLI